MGRRQGLLDFSSAVPTIFVLSATLSPFIYLCCGHISLEASRIAYIGPWRGELNLTTPVCYISNHVNEITPHAILNFVSSHRALIAPKAGLSRLLLGERHRSKCCLQCHQQLHTNHRLLPAMPSQPRRFGQHVLRSRERVPAERFMLGCRLRNLLARKL